ncbi:zinc-dependent peptidase [Sandaracinus amylolyticus]|uniref:M90 family metallopeptidase n=1 Tax=Sandaracinus amylolyticus TaxID=927083 RepID=UPI001F209B62|nr:M90 family metallopeptidase [Sandaracinus amylolyticus]UJR79521.1 Phenylalanyl-tRNA synthetase subunit alpha [Sandaracinus amylolyticus]
MSDSNDRGAAIGAVLVGAALGLLLGLRFGPLAGIVIALVVAIALHLLKTRRTRRRRALARTPFPASMRAVLEARVEYYQRLSPSERRRFEDEVRFFLDEQTITGPRGAALGERLRVLVAASAVIVVFGRRGFRYPKLRDVVVYDEAFDEEYREGHAKHILGMVHGQGPILFSARALEQGFANTRDGLNVGVHEFAHVLDFDTGQADGVPSFMPWNSVTPWLSVMHDEAQRIERRRSILRGYATTNEAEFFAVATEAFFERPRAMRDKHPELYALLRDTFGQDPAASPSEPQRGDA